MTIVRCYSFWLGNQCYKCLIIIFHEDFEIIDYQHHPALREKMVD